MAASVKAYALADGALSDRLLADTRFVKEKRRKNSRGYARKIFRALDNDVKSKSKHARSGSPPRALAALSPAEHRSADYSPRRNSAGHQIILAQSTHRVRGTRACFDKSAPKGASEAAAFGAIL